MGYPPLSFKNFTHLFQTFITILWIKDKDETKIANFAFEDIVLIGLILSYAVMFFYVFQFRSTGSRSLSWLRLDLLATLYSDWKLTYLNAF